MRSRRRRRSARLSAVIAVAVLFAQFGCGQGPGGASRANTEGEQAVSTGKPVSVPKTVLANKFGFLSGHASESGRIKEFGGLWARPHPGPFLWDSMQEEAGGPFLFSGTDELVEGNQDAGVGTLVTIWPFAEWDQLSRGDAEECAVSDQDEFLPKGGLGGPPDYLPEHRCNPADWEAYAAWLAAVVERYDGDGEEDMPGLKIPIKYWEVMNEPDLEAPPEDQGSERLDFYKEDSGAYKELLVKSAKAIKKADPDAAVLIAGAAGGNARFLGFYRAVFGDPEAVAAFDIANVHCISNDDFGSFNVAPYRKLLEEYGIDKPVWVTEAEATVSDDPDVNATEVLKATRKALELGAERIFFTRFDFKNEFHGGGPPGPPLDLPSGRPEISGADPVEAYKAITSGGE